MQANEHHTEKLSQGFTFTLCIYLKIQQHNLNNFSCTKKLCLKPNYLAWTRKLNLGCSFLHYIVLMLDKIDGELQFQKFQVSIITVLL